jgi:sulfoxide reductase heme-binding subunit YedZ
MSDAALLLLRASGWLPALLLALSLSMTPLGALPLRASLRARFARARRPLGMAAGFCALAHVAVATRVYLQSDVIAALREIAWLRSGALALAVLLALLLTSSKRVVRALRLRLWKPLHRFAYVAAALVVHHLLLAPFAPKGAVLMLAAVLGLGLLVRSAKAGAALRWRAADRARGTTRAAPRGGRRGRARSRGACASRGGPRTRTRSPR